MIVNSQLSLPLRSRKFFQQKLLLNTLKMTRLLAAVVLLLTGAANGFFVPRQNPSHSQLVLHAKGFGTKDTPAPKKRPSESASQQSSLSPPPPAENINPFPKPEESDMSEGKAALER